MYHSRAACLKHRRRLFEGLAEHEQLHLIVDGEHTSAGHTTEDVRTSALEERLHAFLSNDLPAGVDRGLVLDGLHAELA